MDPVKIEKLQAMRRYRSLKNRFLINLVQYCLTLVCFGLFLSSPLWLPKLFSALRHVAVVSIPGTGGYLFSPKAFFLLGNAIVIFLVSESKLSTAAASAPDIYDEYAERSKSCPRTCSTYEKEKEEETVLQRPAGEENIRTSDGLEEEEMKVYEEEEVEEEGEEEQEEEEEEGDGWEEDRDVCFDSEEDNALPAEELNRRVEDFIAQVKKQRRLEARLFGG